MQVIVKARHTRVPAALKQLATEKVERVRRIMDRITKLEIEFSEEHNPRVKKKHCVEVILATKAHVLRAEASGIDQASALDAVVDKLEIQVRKLKDKTVKRSRTAAKGASPRKPGVRANGSAASMDRLESLSDSRSGFADVRRTGTFSVKPMTPQQAATMLETTDETFLPFLNDETDLVSVIYRRSDGGFGFVEPA